MPERRQDSGPSLLFEAIALAADRDDVTVLQQAIKDVGGHDGITEDGAPFVDRGMSCSTTWFAVAVPRVDGRKSTFARKR